jgi:hypothetical protein
MFFNKEPSMKSRYSLSLVVLAVLGFVAINFLQLTKAENTKPNEPLSTTEQLIPTDNSVGLIETKELTEAQKAIPDEVAFEVFLRTVGENNARQLLLKAGFDENIDADKLDQMMNDAKSVSSILENFDKQARTIKIGKDGGKSSLASAKVKSDLASLDANRKDILKQLISRGLREATGFDNGWEKLQNYVRSTVKSQMQIVEIKSSVRSKPQRKETTKAAFANNFAAKSAAQTQVGNAYLYSDGWSDGENAFGSGMITEQYASGTSYLASVTVTSPSGRTNTTSGGWDYATLSNSTGISLGFENGTYNIQANFEGDLGGYYDEWGNYYSYGSYYVGSSASTLFLLPRIGVRAMRISPAAGTNNTVNSFTATIQADISSDIGFPSGNVRINLNRTSNPSSVNYQLGSTVLGGTVVPNTQNRGVVIVPDPGDSKTIEWTVTFDNMSPNGAVTESVRIDPSQFPANTITVNPEEASVNFNFQKPTPTPNPTPTPTQGGGGCTCLYAGLGCGGCANYTIYGYANNGCGSNWFYHYGCCCQGSPIVIDIDGNGFAMTNGANGVSFDLSGDSLMDRTSWTTANSDDAWLVLDRNQNHKIDDGKEMFGNYCDQPAPPPGVLRNGFIGLAEFDKAANGGNGDGKITRADTVFRKLRLWQDRNHNGISEPEEVSKLPALDVVALFLDYRESGRTDVHGNRFKYRARVRDRTGARVGRWAWDVFTVPAQ